MNGANNSKWSKIVQARKSVLAHKRIKELIKKYSTAKSVPSIKPKDERQEGLL